MYVIWASHPTKEIKSCCDWLTLRNSKMIQEALLRCCRVNSVLTVPDLQRPACESCRISRLLALQKCNQPCQPMDFKELKVRSLIGSQSKDASIGCSENAKMVNLVASTAYIMSRRCESCCVASLSKGGGEYLYSQVLVVFIRPNPQVIPGWSHSQGSPITQANALQLER